MNDGSKSRATRTPAEFQDLGSHRRHLRGPGPRGLLAFDAARRGAGLGAAAVHAQPRQRQDHVRHRRLFVLPCRAERRSRQGRSLAARRRAGAEIAVRHVLCAEYLARSEGRHRRLERSEFRHRSVEGHVAGRRKPVSGLSLHVLPAHAAQRCARSLCLSENAAAGSGQIARRTICRFRSTSANFSASGSCCSSTAALSCPIRRNRRNGTGAPIW